MNHTTSPLISIIIPVYNAERYVDEALKSVFNQTYTNIEVICVDDKSTDGSLARLLSYGDKITVVQLEHNRGIAAARNKGIERARGNFLAFLDADDIWKLDKLEKQLKVFEEMPTLDMCFGHMQQFISPDANEETKRLRYCNPKPMEGYIAATMLIRKSSFDVVGTFDEKWRIGEFIDWLARAKDIGCTIYLFNEIILLRRIHDTNTVLTNRTDYSDYIRIAKAALERKKNQ